MLQPFLIPLAWAAIAAYTTWPLYGWVRDATRRPRLAASLLTAAVAFGLGVPLAWVLATVANEASHLVLLLQESASGELVLPDWIASRSWLREPIEQLRATWLVDTHALRDLITRNLSEVSSQLLSLAGGLARNVIQFAITLMALFVLYLDGERVLAQARRLAKLFFPAAPRGLRGRHRSRRAGGGLRAARHGGRAGGDRRDRLRDLRRALAGAARHGDGAGLVRARSVRRWCGSPRWWGSCSRARRDGDRHDAVGRRCS